jgi:hypothetical protein
MNKKTFSKDRQGAKLLVEKYYEILELPCQARNKIKRGEQIHTGAFYIGNEQ